MRRTLWGACAGLVSALTCSLSYAAPTCASLDDKCVVDLKTGIRMAYVEAGPKDGPAVILLHGLTDTARSWSLAMQALSSRDPSLHIVAVDQRGHGASSMPAGRSCQAEPKSCFAPRLFADDLADFMDQKGITHATIAGHSMGSMVAQEFGLDYPQKARAVVLIATSARTKDNPVLRDYVLKEPVLGSWKKSLDAQGIIMPVAVWNATPLDADPKAADWIAKNWDVDPIADPKLVAAIVPDTTHIKMGTWLGATEALLDYDNTDRLAAMTVPTLVLWGSQDSIFYKDPDQTGVIGALQRAATAHQTPVFWKQYGTVPLPASGAQENEIGHNVQWDAPEQVVEDILSFIRTGKPTDTLSEAVMSGGAATVRNAPGKATIMALH